MMQGSSRVWQPRPDAAKLKKKETETLDRCFFQKRQRWPTGRGKDAPALLIIKEMHIKTSC